MSGEIITGDCIGHEIIHEGRVQEEIKETVEWSDVAESVNDCENVDLQMERCHQTRKQQKYRKAWEVFPEFQQWLEPVENNVYKAKCKMCAKLMVADLSVLRLHATGKRHTKLCDDFNKAKAALQSMAPTPGSAVMNKPVILPTVRKIKLPQPRRLEESDVTVESLSLSDLNAEQTAYSLDTSLQESVTMEVAQPSVQRHKPSSPEHPVFYSKAIVSKPAPPWKATAIVNGHVTRLELNDYKGRYVILFFYPQDFAAVCPTELLSLSDRVSEFRALQTEIVACSVDSHLTHLTWCRMPRNDGGLANPKIPLLADPTHSISRDYGVLLSEVGHCLRAHFIIDRRGIIRHMSVNDINVGRSIDELIRMVQALQHVDEHETGCPADWKPGLPTV